MKTDETKWLKEYEEFLQADDVVVPSSLTEQVAQRMQKLIKPSAWTVFSKVLGIHVFVGFLSLAVCHQFEMNPFGTQVSLDDWFMKMGGHHVCMILCGILFVGASFLTAGYFLSLEEVRALKRTEFLQSLGLGLLSLALFAVFGAQLAMGIAGLWLLGALLGGFMANQAVWYLKTNSNWLT